MLRLPAITRPIPAAALALAVLFAAAPASAQWNPVPALPVTNVFALQVKADTILAGVDTATYVSTNAGTTWKRSSKVTPGVAAVTAVWMRNGRLYAGTFGQGVFISDNLGTSWQSFNQGLVGGFEDSQLDVDDLQQRGDSLYVATAGAGVYVRSFAPADTWHHFGEQFEPSQASNVNELALGGTRLVASAGGNGTVFSRDPGQAEWTESLLGGDLLPGFEAKSAAWTGTGWIVGTTFGVFRSPLGQEPWTFFDPGVGGMANAVFATQGRRLYGAFVAPNFTAMESSDDDGATWQLLEVLPRAFVFQLGLNGNNLFAARTDGLWVRSIGNVSAPPLATGDGLRLALAGAQPFGDEARLAFSLPEAADASLEVYDVRGRRAGETIRGSFPGGPNVVSWSARGLSPGVYVARLSASGRHAEVKLVHRR